MTINSVVMNSLEDLFEIIYFGGLDVNFFVFIQTEEEKNTPKYLFRILCLYIQ